MEFETRKMNAEFARNHHKGWFKVLRGKRVIEIWVGSRFFFFSR